MSSGIYMYQNKINGKIYIGQSKSLNQRKRIHKTRAFNNYNSNKEYNSLLHQAFRKYGYENFEYSILEECSSELLNEKEIFWIKEKNSKRPNGYNLTDGGNDSSCNYIYEDDIINEVKILLKETSITHQEISDLTGVELSYISKIRNGHYRVNDNEEYPLRPFYKTTREKHNYCEDCGKEIDLQAKKCVECSLISRRTVERPEPLVLAKEIIDNGFEAIGRKYGVSGNSIKKWCVAYGMGKLKHEVAIWYEKNK